jgi:hypothetical protein
MEDANNCSMRRKAMEVSVSVTPLTRDISRSADSSNVRILPGVLKGLDRNHLHIVALGKRRCLGDGYGFDCAGGDSLPRQAIGRGEPPRPLREDANSYANRFRFGERADLAVFCGEIAVTNVHDARIGVGCAAHARCF